MVADRSSVMVNKVTIKTRLLLKASFFFAVSILLLALFNACGRQTLLPAVSISGPTMGTTYNITLVSPPGELDIVILQQEIDRLLKSLNQQMSTYIEDSEILQFNRAGVNQWFNVSADFVQVALLSQKISEISGGYFDISIGPLVELWGFGSHKNSVNDNQVPAEKDIVAAKNRVGWQYLEIDEAGQKMLKKQNLWLDVSAIAKGYAVDQLAEWIATRGVGHFLIEIGGEMRVQGSNRRQQPWRIGIEAPSMFQQQAQQPILLSDKAIATSGDYRNYFEHQGVRYSHTLDPDTGYPVRHNIASVTVIADTAAEADGFATALNAMGEESGMALARAEKLAAFFILYDNREQGAYRMEYTPEFRAYLPP